MLDDPINITTDILIAIREDISSFRTSVEGRFDRVEGRLDRLEQLSRKYRRDAAAMMVIMRATVSDFDERVNEIVEQIAVLDARTS
jgi:DNA repair ATPase RecN